MDLDSAQNALVIILVTLVPTLVIPKALAAVEALTSLHARGRTRGEATTWECPNVKHGIVALSCAMAVLRVEVVDAEVVKQAKHYHTRILRDWPNACFYRDPYLAYDIIHKVVGMGYCDAANRIFDSLNERYTLLDQETIHWTLAGRPRGQVGLMCVREAAIGGPVWALELYSTLHELLGWSEAQIKRAAAGAKLTYDDSLKMDRIVQNKPTLAALRAVKHRWNVMDDERQRKAQALRTLTLKRIGEIEDELRARGEPLVRRRSHGFISVEDRSAEAEKLRLAEAADEEQGALESVPAAGVVARRGGGSRQAEIARRTEAELDPLEELMRNARLSVEHCACALNDIHTGAQRSDAGHESARGYDQGRWLRPQLLGRAP